MSELAIGNEVLEHLSTLVSTATDMGFSGIGPLFGFTF